MSAERIAIGLTRHCEPTDSREVVRSDDRLCEGIQERGARRPRSTSLLHGFARNDGNAEFAPADWDNVRLVVFDIDGTLYSQPQLRLRMLRDMMIHVAKTRSLDLPLVIRAYRRIREQIAEREVTDFETALVAETAAATRVSATEIRAVVDEWIERRPLPYLAACIYPGVAALFSGLRRQGKIIGVLSDYPAAAKLDALGLKADHVLCADDRGIGVLKPNPRGLQVMMEAAGAAPGETVLIGDRADRDGAAAGRAGAWPLIRSAKAIDGWQTFARFDDPLFVNLSPSGLQR
jgi:FMN phosphatase YigB (HAD superfamily)